MGVLFREISAARTPDRPPERVEIDMEKLSWKLKAESNGQPDKDDPNGS